MMWRTIIAGLILLLYGGAAQAQPSGCLPATNPEAALRHFISDARQGNWHRAFQRVAPPARPQLFKPMLAGLITALNLVEIIGGSQDGAAGADKLAAFNQILERYGVGITAAGQYTDLERDVAAIDDWPSLMRDLASFSRSRLDNEMVSISPVPAELHVAGGKATARLVKPNGGFTIVELVKIADGWCITKMTSPKGP